MGTPDFPFLQCSIMSQGYEAIPCGDMRFDVSATHLRPNRMHMGVVHHSTTMSLLVVIFRVGLLHVDSRDSPTPILHVLS